MSEQWRADELADRAGITTALLRSYQSKGLLAPPEREGRVAWYGPAHLERLRRIRDLKDRGYTLKAIAEQLTATIDSPADDATPGPGETLTLDEVAREANVPAVLLRSMERSRLLRPFQVAGEWVYHPEDVAFVQRVLSLLAGGLPLDEFLALAEPHLDMIDELAKRVAAEWQSVVLDRLRESQLPKSRQADVLAWSLREMADTVAQLVAYNLERAVIIDAQAQLDAEGTASERKALARALRGQPPRP
jgi:DNA-binding transcriptional MerR regulator